MESIDRLRRYVECHDKITGLTATCINHLIDSIEKEVEDNERFRREAEPFHDRLCRASERREDVTLFGVGYTALPVDADGEVIHIGELVDEKLPFGGYAAPAPIDTMELSRGASGYRWMVKLDAENRALVSPKLLRHHHAPTVEDVLREFATKIEPSWRVTELPNATLAEYAAKLTLRGGE